MMRFKLSDCCAGLQHLVKGEEGQDLIEYALVVALIAFSATAGMTSIANSVNTVFSSVTQILSANVS